MLCASFPDGTQALMLFETNPNIHLIVTDYHMTVINGPELANRIRIKKAQSENAIAFSAPVTLRWPVIIALSGAAEAGACEYCVEEWPSHLPIRNSPLI